MPPADARHSEVRRRATGAPTARSLLLTILGEYVLPRGGVTWSSGLVAALTALGVETKAARQAIARTGFDGWMRSERAGRRVRWTLTASGDRLLREGAERIYSFGGPPREWDGTWLMLLTTVPETQRDARHRLRVGLSWAGFGALAPGVWVSPHEGREAEAKRVLGELGIAGYSFVARSGAIGDESVFVATAWDLDSLRAAYRAFVDEFDAVRPDDDDAAAFEAQTRLVHQWRRFPFIDPGLPLSVLPPRWIGTRARELFVRRHAAWNAKACAWFDSHAGLHTISGAGPAPRI